MAVQIGPAALPGIRERARAAAEKIEACETHDEAIVAGDTLLLDVAAAADASPTERLVATTMHAAMQAPDLSEQTRSSAALIACSALANGVTGAPGIALAALTVQSLEAAEYLEDAASMGRVFAPALRAHNDDASDRLVLDIAADLGAAPDGDSQTATTVYTEAARRIADGRNRALPRPHELIADFAHDLESGAPDETALRSIYNTLLIRLEQNAPSVNVSLLAETAHLVSGQNLMDSSALAAQRAAFEMVKNGSCQQPRLERLLSQYGQAIHPRAHDKEDRYNFDMAVVQAIERHTSNVDTQTLAHDLQTVAAEQNVGYGSASALLLRGMQVMEQPLRGSAAHNLAFIGLELPFMVHKQPARTRMMNLILLAMHPNATPAVRTIIVNTIEQAGEVPFQIRPLSRWAWSLVGVNRQDASDVLGAGLQQVLDAPTPEV